MNKPKISLAVALLSFCVLALSVLLTRLFAVSLRYHFAFFAISLAICGLGVGGYVAHLLLRGSKSAVWSAKGAKPELLQFKREERILLLGSYGFGFASLFALLCLLRVILPFFPTSYALAGVVVALPFLFAGLVLSVLFRRYAAHIGKLYASDLLGAALASVGSVALLNWLGAVNGVLFLAALSFFVPALLASSSLYPPLVNEGKEGWVKRGLPLLSVTLCLLSLVGALLNQRRAFLDLPVISRGQEGITKPLLMELAQFPSKTRIVYTDWNALGRTDVQEDDRDRSVKHIWIDGEVPTQMLAFDGDLNKVGWLRGFIGSVPYHLRAVKRVLALGAGGGLDVLLALIGNAKEVDAVEVNPSIATIARRYRNFNGGIYERPGVRLIIAEGRSFVKQSKKQYDLIFMALTQTATSGNVGLALVESYIHTIEACRDYYRRLSPSGMIALIAQEPQAAFRWWLTGVAMLSLETGKPDKDCARHLAVLGGPFELRPYRFLVLLSKHPFTRQECDKLHTIAQAMGLTPQFIPQRVEKEPFYRISTGAASWSEVCDLLRAKDLNVAPATDESPFFLDLTIGVPEALWKLLRFSVVVVVLFLFLLAFTTPLAYRFPFIPSLKGKERGEVLPLVTRHSSLVIHLLLFTLYFSGLGIGFMLIEVGLIQRMLLLLISPTHTVALILFALLIGSAGGSWFSQRFPNNQLRSLATAACLLVSLLTALLSLILPTLSEGLLSLPTGIRGVFIFLIVASLGLTMGIPFPSGIRLSTLPVSLPSQGANKEKGEIQRADLVPYLWGVNGVTSVVGSVLAAMGGKIIGFSQVVLAGSFTYLMVALLLLIASRWLERRRFIASNFP